MQSEEQNGLLLALKQGNVATFGATSRRDREGLCQRRDVTESVTNQRRDIGNPRRDVPEVYKSTSRRWKSTSRRSRELKNQRRDVGNPHRDVSES